MIKWEMILAICSLLVAIAASFATIWQGVLLRKHNRISLRPILRIESRVVEDEMASMILTNTGLGTAIIKSTSLLFDGKILSKDFSISADELIREINFNSIKVKKHTLYSGDTFSSSESHYLLESVYPLKDEESLKQIKNIFNHLTFNIKYLSMYGEEFELIDQHHIAP